VRTYRSCVTPRLATYVSTLDTIGFDVLGAASRTRTIIAQEDNE
jgi:hypothetical protein